MKKELRLALRLRKVRYPGQTGLYIEFEAKALADWCCGLCLLKEGLIDVLIIQEKTGKEKLDIRLRGKTKHRTQTQASFEPDATRLGLTPDDLDGLLYFFLKYFRDGFAEVDHLDLDVESETENQDSTLIFKVPEFAQPVSAEEAKKRLGLG